MRLLLNANVYGWRMTGLLGSGAKWFIGFSKRPPNVNKDPGRDIYNPKEFRRPQPIYFETCK